MGMKMDGLLSAVYMEPYFFQKLNFFQRPLSAPPATYAWGWVEKEMKINTWSALLSFLFTLLLFIIGLRIVTGQLQASEIVTSLIIFLPFFVITFAIFYLLVSHIINKFQDHKYIRPILTSDFPKKRETEIKYFLPMVYRCLGILLIVSAMLLYYIDHPALMVIIIFFLGIYYLKTPYKIEIEGDTYTIFLLLGKKKIQSDDVRAVKLGVFHNRVDFAEEFIC
jgi:4-hydroxybenzoate polyprenyltransferase